LGPELIDRRKVVRDVLLKGRRGEEAGGDKYLVGR